MKLLDPFHCVSGISEVFINPARQHVYIRGYALALQGELTVRARLHNETDIAPTRERIRRPDLAAKYPDADLNCGFEFYLKLAELSAVDAPLRIVVRHSDGSERAQTVLVDSKTKTLAGDVSLRSVVVNLVAHCMTLEGMLEGESCGFALERVMLGDAMLNAPQINLGTLRAPTATAPARRSFVITVPTEIKFEGELFQAFPAAGQEVQCVFRPPGREYMLAAGAKIDTSGILTAVGAITAVKWSQANRMTEVRGVFIGSQLGARVQLKMDGKSLGRPARLEATASTLPNAIAQCYDLGFSDWTWCDEIPPDGVGGSILRAELVAGNRTIGAADLRLQKDTIVTVQEALGPSYFASPYEAEFLRLVTLALTPFENPVVYSVFPGNLFRTLAGGPARVIEMARYLSRMGFAVVLVDLAEPGEGEGEDQVPPRFADIFPVRIGLQKELLDEFARLALDHIQRDPAGESARDMLGQALERQETDTADLILRRTDARFNALATFFALLSKPDFIICNFAWTAPVCDALPANICKILDLHDVQYQRGLIHQEVTGEVAYLASLDVELEAVRKADYVLAIQADDKDFIIEHSGRNNVVLCGHTKPIVEHASVAGSVHRLLFVGNRYPPNTLGLRNFLENCWPRVREAVPDAILYVVGSVADDLLDVPEGVELLGRVQDLDAVYARVALVINPVEFGSGLNIKSVECLCHGRCLVSTEFGLRGLPVTKAEARRCEAATMHQDIVELLLNSRARKKMEKAALAFAKKNLSQDAVFRELFNTMELRLYA